MHLEKKPSAVFIAQLLLGPSKQLKQIFQIQYNIVENPSWPEANFLAVYKRGRGFELGATEGNKSRQWSERDWNPGPLNCESDTLTTRPRCLPTLASVTIPTENTNMVHVY